MRFNIVTVGISEEDGRQRSRFMDVARAVAHYLDGEIEGNDARSFVFVVEDNPMARPRAYRLVDVLIATSGKVSTFEAQ